MIEEVNLERHLDFVCPSVLKDQNVNVRLFMSQVKILTPRLEM